MDNATADNELVITRETHVPREKLIGGCSLFGNVALVASAPICV